MDMQAVIQKLRDIVGQQYVTTDEAARYAYTQDASVFGGTDAEVVVRPASTEEVSALLSFLNDVRIPVVVRGGGSSIYGQPHGIPGRNVLIDMGRMNRVLDLNERNMTVTAQCGIIMGKLQHACNSKGFYIFTPSAPVHTVSLGGWMSGAAGGGGIWWETISVTVVLPDGTVVKTGGGPGTNVNQQLFYSRIVGGPDFSGMFTGDGGAFGIKTEATIRLVGLPPVTRASIFEFSRLEDALALVEAHVRRVNPHPFNPVLIFGPGAMDIFMPGAAEEEKFTVMGMMQGHTVDEMEASRKAFDELGKSLGGQHTEALDAMAEAMSKSGDDDEASMEMWGLSFFNGLGLAAWLPFTVPRISLKQVYPRLIAWRDERLKDARARGFECCARFEFFAPSDQCSITGEIDAFFKDTDTPELRNYVREMIFDFQKFTHELGFVDLYNQGVMSNLNAQCWSPGYKTLFQTVKKGLDPNGILNPGLW